MILIALIVIPFAGGLLAWLAERQSVMAARLVALAAVLIDLMVAMVVWAQHLGELAVVRSGPWLVTFYQPWIPQAGIHLNLALDGLSLVLVVLTAFLGVVAVAVSWNEISQRVGLFHFNLLWVLAATTGVFLALDLFLFYFFWEMMLVPMFFLIAIWGEGNRVAAAIKFFVFTQVGGLLMLVAILGLYITHGQASGSYTFDYLQLLGTQTSPSLAIWLMLGFFIAFAVKVPLVPIHSWLPDAYTSAPVAGTIILAGLMAKTGIYGILRFVIPLFPAAAAAFAPVAMALAVIGVLYGAVVAFSQADAKRLVAYASLSHVGLITLGVFAWTQLALQGVVLQMVCHGIVVAALFLLVGAIEARIRTRDLAQMQGLWSTTPRLGAISLLFALALLGLPGLGTFVGEFLVLLGTYAVRSVFAIIAALGIVLTTIYALWLVQRAFQGVQVEGRELPDLSRRELLLSAVLIVVIVWLGLYPQPVLDTASQSLENLRTSVATSYVANVSPARSVAWLESSGAVQMALFQGGRQ